jgi:hypothetical protein
MKETLKKQTDRQPKVKLGETGIKTVYYRRGKDPKVNRSKDANRAVGTCVLHMQINQYGAHLAEVYDAETGERHCAVKRSVTGKLTIEYDRDPAKFETKYAIGFVLNL